MGEQLFDSDVPKRGIHRFTQLGKGFQRGCRPRQFAGFDEPGDHGRRNGLGVGAKMNQVSRFEWRTLFLTFLALVSHAGGRDTNYRV